MKRDLTIYVSGLYSGTNPQPGVGIARSLRKGFPRAKLVGVEYSNRCSGIHWTDFDEIWLQRPWNELNLELHADEIRRRLDDGGYWISSIDLEIKWLGEAFANGHPNLLIPSTAGLEHTAKPEVPAHDGLPLRIPVFILTSLSDWEIHSFCRRHDWKVWLKGPYYEAVRIPTWEALQHWRNVLSKAWATDTLYLQAHVSGYEESVMLASYSGEIADCVYMRKRDVTELGKTWAGKISDVPDEILDPLRHIVRDLNWTGGAELEMIRDPEDKLWLLEWNPRFPAWVHGATLAGRNLPAALVEAASGMMPRMQMTASEEFTRVVVEVPVKEEFPLSPLCEPFAGGIGHSMKHPSGLVEFSRRLNGSETRAQPCNGHAQIPESYLRDLDAIEFSNLITPATIFFANTAAETFRRAALISHRKGGGLWPSPAYSIKTNPDERLLRLAREHGLLAEAISTSEANRAVDVGFRTDQIVLNGPAKWWHRELLPQGELHSIFCDSVDELLRITREIDRGSLQTRTLGLRLRAPNIVSRFGARIDSPELFGLLINAVRRIPRSARFGIHFHVASSNIGIAGWRHLFKSMLKWCRSIEELSDREVDCLDIGGGWFPDDAQYLDHQTISGTIREVLPGVTELICEPGKAVAQSSMAIAMSVLEVRRYPDRSCEVVMDGSIADLPMHFYQPHRIVSRDRKTGEWRPLGRGDSSLFGRTCMEHDILAANVELPPDTKAGDVLVFCDAGAYDRSMSYAFGCG